MKKEFQNVPLAERFRPDRFEDFFGQEKLVGKGSYLRKSIEKDEIPSMIFWGPPGTGKTTLALIIAKKSDSEFVRLSAVESGKKDLMKIIERAQEYLKIGKRTIVFIDEIHRWNKAQQDALLPYVENGTIVLIGATTENPSFEVNSALLSRTRVFVLEKLEVDDIKKILKKAVKDPTLKYKGGVKKITGKAINLIAELSNGDSRMALNTLESAMNQNKKIDEKLVREVLQKMHIYYDKQGEEHYNIISALHKSMRGGDANAAVYWLARMLEAGEDPIYVARRLVRFASEDVGLADNRALPLANAAFDACQKIGMPECSVNLSQCVIYLAKTKKSIAAYTSYEKAKRDVFEYGNLPVPLHLRNAPAKLMKELEYGKNYKYTPLKDSSDQQYFPDKLKNRRYFKG